MTRESLAKLRLGAQEGDVSRLSEDAGPINGTYCRRYRDAAVATRASFNENPWELMRNNNR